MARRARVEGEVSVSDPVPGDNGEALARIVDFFRASHPDQWEAMKLCPLQYALTDMIEALKA